MHLSRSVVSYTIAVLSPVAVTLLVTLLKLPAFLFEHIATLLVVGLAIPYGLGPALAAAVACVSADNVLLREPIGRPTITGARDAIDLVLFVVVAVVISALVRRAHTAASRERDVREQRDRLIAAVSHDLATPLTVLSATVQFARQHGIRSDLDSQRLLTRLETAAARATSLIKTLREARALDTNDLALQFRAVNLPQLVAGTTQMMDQLSDRHPILLTVGDESVTVDADVERLQRVVENLLNNAIKYSPDGGPIEVSVARDGSEALLAVRDHGMGVSVEARSHIFERSYRAPEATETPGLGLGLSIAAHIVKLHKGTIRLDTPQDGGAVFTVRLPVSRRSDVVAGEKGMFVLPMTFSRSPSDTSRK